MSAVSRTGLCRFRSGVVVCLFALALIGLLTRPSFPETFPRTYLQGFRALQEGNLARAIVLLEEAVGAMPESAALHSDLGTAYYRRGDFSRAAREYATAAQLEPKEAIYHNNLAAALIRQDQPHKALEAVRAALLLRPDFQDAIVNHGVILLRLDRYAEAEEVLRRVTTPRLQTLCNLALSQYRQAKYDEALKAVDRALALPEEGEKKTVLRAFRDQILSVRSPAARALTGFSFAVKGGYVDRRRSSDYFDATEAIGAFKAEDFNSPAVEGEAEYRFSPYFSLSGSVGYFDGQETGLRKTTTTGVLLDGDVEFGVLYGLMTAKAHLPVRSVDFYVGAGTGWYNLKRKVRLANQVPEVAKNTREERNFSNVGFHGVGGVAVNLGSRLFLLGEVRGFRARFNDNVNAGDDTLDLGPLMYLGGVGLRF